MHVNLQSIFTTHTNSKYHSSHLYTNNHLYHATENTANQNTAMSIVHYYMAESHKDWELANSRISFTEINIESGLDFPIYTDI